MLKKLLVALFLVAALPAQAALEATLIGGDTAPMPIALVPFQVPAEVQTDLAQVVDRDLYYSGRFRPLPRDRMPQKPTQAQDVQKDLWAVPGIDNVVVGQVSSAPGGGYLVQFALVDTVSGQKILEHRFNVKTAASLRTAAHMISDMVYEKLLGVPGYFSAKIAYVSAKGYGPARRFQLIMSDSDGFNEQVIANSHEPILSPVWSPDRRKLAFVGYTGGRSAIMLFSLDTRQVTRLVFEPGLNSSPAWSPDGTKLAASLSFETNPDIYVIDVATGKRRRLTDHYGIDTEPSWSPDGSKLVFTSDRGGKPQIYEISASGGDPRRVTFEGSQNARASYSPDGKSLTLVNTDGGQWRVALLDLATGKLKLLSDGPQDDSPKFAPGGAVIIYATQGRAGGAELAIVSVDGAIRNRLKQSANSEIKEPAWSSILR